MVNDGRIMVSPRARKLAKELKVDLSTLKGSGPHGRIVAEDGGNKGKQPDRKASPENSAPTHLLHQRCSRAHPLHPLRASTAPVAAATGQVVF